MEHHALAHALAASDFLLQVLSANCPGTIV
jgi:hypothetical protein